MTNKNSSYNANFWLFLREKALSFHENSKCTLDAEELKEEKPANNIVNLSKNYDVA